MLYNLVMQFSLSCYDLVITKRLWYNLVITMKTRCSRTAHTIKQCYNSECFTLSPLLLAGALARVYMSLFLTSPFKGFSALARKCLNVSVNPGMGSYIPDVLIGVVTVFTLDRLSGMVLQMCVQFTAPFESPATLRVETNKSLV